MKDVQERSAGSAAQSASITLTAEQCKSFEQQYQDMQDIQDMQDENKWRLSDGTVVEDELLYKYARTCSTEQ